MVLLWWREMSKRIMKHFCCFEESLKIQLMDNCWFGSRWFGFRLDPPNERGGY